MGSQRVGHDWATSLTHSLPHVRHCERYGGDGRDILGWRRSLCKVAVIILRSGGRLQLQSETMGWEGSGKRSVQFSCSVMSDSLWSHGLQQARLPCPSPTHGACSNSCSSSQWCHPTISSSVIPFSCYLKSFPALGSFLVSSLHQVAKVLEFQLQHQSFQQIFRADFL